MGKAIYGNSGIFGKEIVIPQYHSGDLIYSGCLDAFYPTTDPQLFMQSVKKVRRLEINRVLPAHHQLSVPVDLVDRIEKAFTGLEKDGKLVQGSDVTDYHRQSVV